MKVSISKNNRLQGVHLEEANPEKTLLLYGVRSQHSDLTTRIAVHTEKEVSFHSTCGCTTSEETKTEDGYEISLKYDARNLGDFSKQFLIKEGGNTLHKIVLRGIIVT